MFLKKAALKGYNGSLYNAFRYVSFCFVCEGGWGGRELSFRGEINKWQMHLGISLKWTLKILLRKTWIYLLYFI